MYHITNNKRQKKTAYKIYQSLRHILFTKKLKDVTITDIYTESHIARSTIYRLFDNVCDILEYQLEVYMEDYISTKINKSDKILYFYEFFSKHIDLINIISNENEFIIKKVFEKIYKTNNELILTLKISIMTSLLSEWAKNYRNYSVKEMVKITKENLNLNVIEILKDF